MIATVREESPFISDHFVLLTALGLLIRQKRRDLEFVQEEE